jgi:ornithine decarboxylase
MVPLHPLGTALNMTQRIFQFLDENRPETPCLIVDLHEVENNYRRLKTALSDAKIYYAVKANPAPQVIRVLHLLGARFDAASIFEIEQCLDIGISPADISFGNTIKKETHIALAFKRGIRLFAYDSEAELEKIARVAPEARVYCRFFMTGEGADWPLSEKFGCDSELVPYLLRRAKELGLVPYGVSFHVGSQQRNLDQWEVALEKSATIFKACAADGIGLKMVNIGGGFPSSYRSSAPSVEAHSAAVMDGLKKYFVDGYPEIIAEPGRYIPGDAGVIQSEVVLIANKSRMGGRRWVYLDVGRFGGLPEVMDEAIQYRIRTPHDESELGPVVIAGPTCDEADVLYQNADYSLPLALKVGDKIEILSTGAYTASYSAVGFNGFPPLREIYI